MVDCLIRFLNFVRYEQSNDKTVSSMEKRVLNIENIVALKIYEVSTYLFFEILINYEIYFFMI